MYQPFIPIPITGEVDPLATARLAVNSPRTFGELAAALKNGGTIVLSHDITEPPGYAWEPVEAPAGTTIEGNQHRIGDPEDPARQLHKPLLGGSAEVPIDGLNISDVQLFAHMPDSLGPYVGGFARVVKNACFANCTVSGIIEQNNDCIGGLAGQADGGTKFKCCVNLATVSGQHFVGGIAGAAGTAASTEKSADVFSCSNYGDIFGKEVPVASTDPSKFNSVGGIVGFAKVSDIRCCNNYGNVTGIEMFVGGVSGRTISCTVTHCANFGAVYGNVQEIGGIIGSTQSSEPTRITYCRNEGDVFAIGGTGLCDNPADASTCPGPSSIGGIVGFLREQSVTDHCVNTGAVNIHGGRACDSCNNTGGVAGTMFSLATIVDCSNTGDIFGRDSIGGIAGSAQCLEGRGYITNNMNSGNVTGTADSVGGIVGSIVEAATVTRNTIARPSEITGAMRVGGVAGQVVDIPQPPDTQTNYVQKQAVVAHNAVDASKITATDESNGNVRRILAYIGVDGETRDRELLLYGNTAAPSVIMTGNNALSGLGYDYDTQLATKGLEYRGSTVKTNDPDYGASRLNGKNKNFSTETYSSLPVLNLSCEANYVHARQPESAIKID